MRLRLTVLFVLCLSTYTEHKLIRRIERQAPAVGSVQSPQTVQRTPAVQTPVQAQGASGAQNPQTGQSSQPVQSVPGVQVPPVVQIPATAQGAAVPPNPPVQGAQTSIQSAATAQGVAVPPNPPVQGAQTSIQSAATAQGVAVPPNPPVQGGQTSQGSLPAQGSPTAQGSPVIQGVPIARASSAAPEVTNSGDENSSEDDNDEYSCYYSCVETDSDLPIVIDYNLKFNPAVAQTNLAKSCQIYQTQKSCVDACPSSAKTNSFNDRYKRVSFICQEKLSEASRYFSCIYNDNRNYENECVAASSSVTDEDVTKYCKKQRCIMRTRLPVIQQRCPDIVQFARTFYTFDVDTTEKAQEFGSLWTKECENLQNDLRSTNPL